MKKKSSNDFSIFRQKAEKLLKLSHNKFKPPTSKSELATLIHELEVHQIELEMQNNDLVIAIENAEISEKRYSELYDFAPSGYITLSKANEITNINFAAASILCKERLDSINNNFGFFVSINTRNVFNDFIEKVFTSKTKQTCEVILAIKGNLPVYVAIYGLVSKKSDECFLTIIDITELKKSEYNLLEAQRIANLASFIWDLKAEKAEVSSNFYNITGVPLNEELKVTFAEWKGIVHPDDHSNNIKTLFRCIESGEKFDLIYRILANDTQKLKWVHAYGEVVRENGVAVNFVGTIQDVTVQKNAELELKHSYEEIRKLKAQLEEENINLKEEIALAFNYENLVYSSQEISDVLTQVEQVSNTKATVLLLGETGTGKELIAKAIHNTSNRKNNSLIRVNCAAIPAELLESELFGHQKGSFTGAIKDRIGKFQLANGGTLFLDEIGEMPLELQPKLLRAIQEGEIEPIGSSKVIKLDIRIIAATNRDIEKEVEQKRFRQDLFFRLNVFPITIPPLRQRIDDIPLLVNHFLDKYCIKYQKNIKSLPKSTLQQMKIYQWPGNVRELENVIERAVITSSHNKIIFPNFDITKPGELEERNTGISSLVEAQSTHIIKALNLCNWKISGKDGAAIMLDIRPSTLRDRMKKFGIKRS